MAEPAQRYRFGEVEVLCAERRVLVAGQPVKLGARAFDLLHMLLEHRDRVVTKDELLDRAWPGMVVEEANVQVQVSALRKLIGPDAVATIPGQGYRFSATLDDDVSAAAAGSAAAADQLPIPDKPSVAVLPFGNLSADLEQGYFADGVTDDISTELSRFRSLFVIGRSSTLTCRSEATDVRAIAARLGVRYVVEGSVRRAGDRVRITAQLIDASTGRHLWSDHYDSTAEGIFAVQDEVTRSIVAAIAPEVANAETSKVRRRRPASFSAYEIALRGWADLLAAYRNSDEARRASGLHAARSALAIDPESTLALNTLAYSHWLHVFWRTAPSLEEAWKAGMEAATRACEIDGSDAVSWVVKALLLTHDPFADAGAMRYDEALLALRTAHRLNPNDHFALRVLGHTEAVSGDPVQGIAHLEQALRLNPLDPHAVNVMNMLSLAHFLARNYEEGVRWGGLAAASAPKLPNGHLFLAMNHVGRGDIAHAKLAWDRAQRLGPDFVEARLRGYSVYRKPDDRLRQKVFVRIAAGLEDPSAADAIR